MLTAQVAFEVERHTKWPTAVRQALQYSAQSGCRPAIALFGNGISKDALLKMYRKLRDGCPPIELWWWRYDNGWRWYRITSVDEAARTATALRRFGGGDGDPERPRA